MTTARLTTRPNRLRALYDELVTEGKAAKRRSDAGWAEEPGETDDERVDTMLLASRDRGVQDTYGAVAGRLYALLNAPLGDTLGTELVDELEVALLVRFSADPAFTGITTKATRIALETILAKEVGA